MTISMKIRIKFKKYGIMKFIGHLDMMRYFQKAMRRANIEICYSAGFSPHQIMSFAAPLGVGITSDGEYFDIEVQHTSPPEEAIKSLNDTMADGIEVTDYVILPDNASNAMSIVAAADYDVSFREDQKPPASYAQFLQGLDLFFYQPQEVLIKKQTKKSERTIDLKKLVYEIRAEETDGTISFYMMLSTGSSDNLKPELVLQSLFSSMGLAFEEDDFKIHRRDVYADDGKRRIPLGEFRG